MAIEFLEKKLIKSTNITGDHGGFSLEEPLNFEMCRERFAALFTETTRGFYFKVPQNKGTSVAEFLLKTEKLFKLQVHSGFALTNRRTIIWVQRFWTTRKQHWRLQVCFWVGFEPVSKEPGPAIQFGRHFIFVIVVARSLDFDDFG